MPRRARIVAADTPFHVIQRGIDRGACFFSEDDFRFYLEALATAASSENVAVHAYVLMTNHVHLLVTGEAPDGISNLMKRLGQCYVTSQKPWAGAWHWGGFETMWSPTEHASEVPVERIDPDGLDRQLGLMVDIELAAAGGLSVAP